MSAPRYDLTRVVEAAIAGHVSYARRVQIDFQELGYSFADVCQCIASLTVEDYRGSVVYDGVELDVYHPRFSGPEGQVDELYVKLFERSRATVPQVVLGSFHLPR